MHTSRPLYIFLLSIILVHSCSKGYGQNPGLSGTITDEQTGKPLAGVLLRILELGKTTQSDSLGNFALAAIPTSIFHLEVVMLGYSGKILDVNASQGKIIISLRPISIETNEVMITGLAPHYEEVLPYSSASIGTEAMRDRGAFTLSDALAKSVPGVQQLSTGPGISKPVIRGLYGNRILTTIDGVRFDNQQWQDEHGMGLSDLGVERVEVIRGPASLQFGSEAMGGVLNVISERPAQVGSTESDFGLKLFANGPGTALEYGIKKSVTGRSWRIRLGLEAHADYSDGNDQRIVNTRFNGTTLRSGWNWYRGKRTTSLDYMLSLYNFGFVTNDNYEHLVPDNRLNLLTTLPHHSVAFQVLSWQTTWYLSELQNLKLNFSAVTNNRQEAEGGNKISLNMLLNTLGYDVKWSKNLFHQKQQPTIEEIQIIGTNARGSRKSIDLIVGSQGMIQNNTNFGARVIIPDADITEAGAFGFLSWQQQRWRSEVGLRYDFRDVHALPTDNGMVDIGSFEKSFHAINGSIGGSYYVAKGWRLKLNAASGYRSPNLAELGSQGLHEGTFRWEVGNKDMRKEQSFNVDAGIIHRSRSLDIEIGVYQNYIKDYIFLQRIKDRDVYGFQLYNYMQNDATLRGGEIGLDWKPNIMRWIDFRGSYAHTDARQQNGASLPFIPANKFTGEIRLEFESLCCLSKVYIRFGAEFVLKQFMPGQFEEPTPAYNLLNAGLGCKIQAGQRKIDLSLSGDNLLNNVYFDHLSRFKPMGLYNPGRNISFHMRIPLGKIRP